MDATLFELAKRVNLHSFLARINGKDGYAGSAGWVRFDTCPNCGHGKSSDERMVAREGWKCHSCGKQGDVIDAAAFYWKVSKSEAAKMLVSDYAVVSSTPAASTPVVIPEEELARKRLLGKIIARIADTLHSSTLDKKCVEYLVDQRGIPLYVVQEAHHRGLLVTLPGSPFEAGKWLCRVIGEEALRKSGLWKEGKKMPGICYKPIVFISARRTSAEFRMADVPKADEIKSIRYGDSDWWIWRGKAGHENRCAVVEGCIDLLSMAAMDYKGTIFGLPGCNSWVNWSPEKLDQLAETVQVCLDNDASVKNPGQRYAAMLVDRLREMDRVVQHRVPPPGKDINDLWRERFVQH